MIKHHYTKPREPKRVIIIGSSGFVGSSLMNYYSERGIEVIGLNSKEFNNLEDDAAQYVGNLLREQDILVVLSAITPDKSKDPKDSFIKNIQIVKTLCDALQTKTCSQIIYVSSDSVYKYTEKSISISEKTIPEPESLYGMMHLIRENIFRLSAKSPLLILRSTQVYGAGDTHNSYGPCRMLRSAIDSGTINLFGQGEETRDHIYIEDVVKIITTLIQYRSEGLMNMTTGISVSFLHLAEIIQALFNKPIKIISIPSERIITHRQFDDSLMKENFSLTTLQSGLMDMKCQLSPC